MVFTNLCDLIFKRLIDYSHSEPNEFDRKLRKKIIFQIHRKSHYVVLLRMTMSLLFTSIYRKLVHYAKNMCIIK